MGVLAENSLWEDINYDWLGLGNTSAIKTTNPLLATDDYSLDNPDVHILSLLMKPEYFGITCKYLFNKRLAPFQLAILQELWYRPFPLFVGSRGVGKSWLLAIYCVLRALFQQGSKIVICGAGFRQAKIVFEYAEDIFLTSPILQDMLGGSWNGKENGPKHETDKWVLRLGESTIIAIPIGAGGDKVRGLRSTTTIADEIASINMEVFETVIGGFSSVNQDPVEQMIMYATHKKMQKVGLIKNDEQPEARVNQTIMSGTGYYSFNHWYTYWKKWKSIVESKGDPLKLREIFPGGIPTNFNWKDYSVIRIPWEIIPEGYLNDKVISKAKATIHSSVYLNEFCACFANDSTGFFKRSLIEGCTVGKKDNPIIKNGQEIIFSGKLIGNPGMKHIIAIDPAAVNDNFSITVLELWPDHRRIVYGWTTNVKKHAEQVKLGVSSENDYYGYCARKIRNLLQRFPSEHIVIDSQGGGGAIIQALHANDRVMPGELPIWPAIIKDEPKESDRFEGLHIIDIINFASATWVSEANHGLRYDLEHHILLFPMFDAAAIGIAMEQDKICGRVLDEEGEYIAVYDTLEDTFLEIESLKDELATIVHSQTGKSGRDHWDTPEIKIGEKKGRMRKDRYSSLLMANGVARRLQEESLNEGYLPEFTAYGGFASDLAGKKATGSAGSQGRGSKKYLEFMRRSLGHLG